MQTITFYSYKGGVGRTLVVANVARYLARFGQRVFAIDFDLEAPGLHYKLQLGQSAEDPNQPPIDRGLVDYIHDFALGQGRRRPLREHVIELPRRGAGEGSITLLPAGSVPSKEYWRKLAQINWHDCFFAPHARGIPFFLELKEEIEEVFAPDFLLLDSRTGITEIGGVATTLLPDQVVCLLLNNLENLEGAREVLHSIQRTPRLTKQPPIEIIPVLTRLPELDDLDQERRLTEEVEHFLSREAEDLSATLAPTEVLILHSEPDLQIRETLRIGGRKRPEESPLLRDYLRLFARLFPKKLLESYIGPLVQEAMSRALDDPENTEKNLQALTSHAAHPEAHRALLKFYRLRREDAATLLRTAENFWRATGQAKDPLIVETVRESLSTEHPWRESLCSAEFIDAVWSEEESDLDLGLDLARLYIEEGKSRKTVEVLLRLFERLPSSAHDAMMPSLCEMLQESQDRYLNGEMMPRILPWLRASSKNRGMWAEVVLSANDRRSGEALLQIAEAVDEPAVDDPLLLARLLHLAKREEDLEAHLKALLTNLDPLELDRSGFPEVARRIAHCFREIGRWQLLEAWIRETFDEEGQRLWRRLDA